MREEEMKELILDGFFRCPGRGQRYHLVDVVESEALCNRCGTTLEPEKTEEDYEDEEKA